MKKLLLLLMASCSLLASAQQVSVVQRTRLLSTDAAFYPVLSPDGSQLLFSSADAQGLQFLNLNTGRVESITTATSAGRDAKWGPDGNVYYVTQSRNAQNLTLRTAYRYDVATGANTQLLAAQHGPVQPEVGTAGMAVNGPRKSYRSARNLGTSVRTQGSKVILTVNGKTREFSPVESWAGYLWPSLSPDGTKVLFYAAEKGAVVIDLNGHVLSMLGRIELPQWYNNDYILGQRTTDDGHQFTASHIELAKADGSFRTNLTDEGSMTFQPTTAVGKIVYTTIDGQAYLMTINIK